MLYAHSNVPPKPNLTKVRKPFHRPAKKALEKISGHNKKIFIRHPSELPISYRPAGCVQAAVSTCVENPFVGLSLEGDEAVEPGTILDVTIKVGCEDHTFQGQVVWIRHLDQHYELGLCFADVDDAFRVRMIEQVCRIELYYRRLCEIDGRDIDVEQAAKEWIEKFSAQFPKLLPGS